MLTTVERVWRCATPTAASISIAAIESRLPPERIENIALLLHTEARKIEKMLHAA